LENKRHELHNRDRLTITGIGGASALVAGLASYLKATQLARQQAALTEQLERLKGEMQARLELLKLDNERLKFAHTKQFEKEFSLYEDLWEKLWTLNAAASRLGDDEDRELTQIVSGEDEFAKSHQEVMDLLKPASEITEWSAPFFHLEIYTELDHFVHMCTRA
jgi:hypothetical protein